MDSEPGRSFILWAARLSVALYSAAVIGWLGRRARASTRIRWFWVASWATCVFHVLLAFHFEHHWSQSAAWQHTAETTERVVGWYWGGGLYVNYVFLAFWGWHAMAWLSGEPAVSVQRAMHAVAAFMMFNATAVFGPGWWWIPVALVGVLGIRQFWLKRKSDDQQ